MSKKLTPAPNVSVQSYHTSEFDLRLEYHHETQQQCVYAQNVLMSCFVVKPGVKATHSFTTSTNEGSQVQRVVFFLVAATTMKIHYEFCGNGVKDNKPVLCWIARNTEPQEWEQLATPEEEENAKLNDLDEEERKRLLSKSRYDDEAWLNLCELFDVGREAAEALLEETFNLGEAQRLLLVSRYDIEEWLNLCEFLKVDRYEAGRQLEEQRVRLDANNVGVSLEAIKSERIKEAILNVYALHTDDNNIIEFFRSVLLEAKKCKK